LTIPELTIRPAIREDRLFTPFGWSRSAVELNKQYRNPAAHPDWTVVRRVNGRDFGAGLAHELDENNVTAVSSLAELDGILATLPDRADGWIVKANHGNAGLGNRRLRSRRLGDRDRRWIERLFEEDDLLLLEPWRRRELDLSVSFDLRPDGTIDRREIHEVVNTADGAFIGALFEPRPSGAEPWIEHLGTAASLVAARLHEHGYFGNVKVDAFVWKEDDRLRLRPLVDLNARSNISRSAWRLWVSWGRPAVLYWRFFTRGRLRLPDTHDELIRRIGDDRFDPGSRRGVLPTSPLWVEEDGNCRPLHKLGVLFVADTRPEVMAQERRFRDRFDRP
jgi:hypothetical protein